ncbi:MAG: hypothetical protein A7316_05955 [Candidatus Altiarchaeales archaeon WOR_SM1_86-2]|nr:MAG: hypothetical protein A7315_15010 [Candidatus Altiarchaeales archaeon WOR_SM1_79]ODS39282.1 MAG: hypothetical protein A7316_05955 [Candidatus Altiarchaeales archaeon WOR_SM1_86-2]
MDIVGLVMGLVQLIIGLFLAIAVIYLGIKLFGWATKGIDEWEELKNGNAAVGIVLAAIVIALATVVQSGIVGLTGTIMNASASGEYVMAIIGGVVQLIMGIILAVVAIWLAIFILGRVTKDIDEAAELKNGNVAVAILMAGVLIAVGFVIQSGVSGLSRAIGV